MTPTTGISTEIIASDVNFESLINDFILHSEYRRCDNFYLQKVIFQKMSHEKHHQRRVHAMTPCNVYNIF